jgi:hypothetical protein
MAKLSKVIRFIRKKPYILTILLIYFSFMLIKSCFKYSKLHNLWKTYIVVITNSIPHKNHSLGRTRELRNMIEKTINILTEFRVEKESLSFSDLVRVLGNILLEWF